MEQPIVQQPGFQQPGFQQPGFQQPGFQQEPYRQEQRVTVISVPQGFVRPGQQQNIREWSTGFCACFEDCNTFCHAYCCYSCFLASLATRMDECYCGPHCYGYCLNVGTLLIPFCPPLCPNSFLVAMRTKIRAQHGIRGSICSDISLVWCCEFCATTQMARELKHVG